MSALTSDQRDRLRLIRTPHIGPVAFRHLMMRFGTAGRALEALPDRAARGGKRSFRPVDLHLIDKEIERVAKLGARYIFSSDPDYPALLAQAESAPPALIVRGNLDLASRRCVWQG